MKLSDVKKLATAFEQSDWDEIHLVVDGVEIHLSASGEAHATLGVATASTARLESAAAATPAPAAPAPATSAGHAQGHASHADPASGVSGGDFVAGGEAGAVPHGEPVRSPSPGIFWRSPSPGAPPFVEVGQHVEPDTTVCIVEVMKLMQRVPAGVTGTVSAVLVENSQSVDKDQPLVIVVEEG